MAVSHNPQEKSVQTQSVGEQENTQMRSMTPPQGLFGGVPNAGANNGGEGGYPPGMLEFIRLREGYKTYAYLDKRKLPTAGLGHLLVGDEKTRYPIGTEVPKAVLDGWEKHDMTRNIAAARAQIAQLPPAANTADFLIALTSVNFQNGEDWNHVHKKTWKLMKEGRWAEAADSDWARQTPVRVEDFQRALRSLAAGGSGSPVPGNEGGVAGNGNVVPTANGSISGTDINVRKGPGTTFAVARQLNTGDKVSVYESRNGWVRIAPGQWVKAEFVKQTAVPAAKPVNTAPQQVTTKPTTPASSPAMVPIGSGILNGSNVNVRTGPGLEHNISGIQFEQGMRLSYYENIDGWLRVGPKSWISSQFLTQQPQNAAPVAGPKETGTITGSDINVRSGPGVQYNAVGDRLQSGAPVPIYEVKYGWLRIGEGKWVLGSYVNYSGNRPTKQTQSTPVHASPTTANTATGSKRMPVTLKDSVGAGGANIREDVLNIQHLLQDLGFAILATGSVGKQTIGAIASVQVANSGSSDGLVNPGKETLRILNATPSGAFRNTAKQLLEDKDAPRLKGNWKNAAHLSTDTSGVPIPRQFYANMRELIRNMDVIRANLKGTLEVGCGYRSPGFNSTLDGAASQSNHLFGRAVDIYSDYSPVELRAKLRQLIKEGKIHPGGIGLYNWGCHYDIDGRREW